MKLARQMRKNPNMVGRPYIPNKPRAGATGDVAFGDKLKALRHSAALTLEVAAVEIGISKGGLTQIENGHHMPNVAHLIRLAAFYEVSLDRLCGHMVAVARDK